MNQTRKPLNSSAGQEMDKSIKYNLVEDVTVKHQSNLADIPMTKVQSNSILKSDQQEQAGAAETLDQLLAEGSLAGREIPASTSVVKQPVTRDKESPTRVVLNTSEDQWGDQLLLTFNSLTSEGGGGLTGVQGKQSFIVLIS